MSVVMEDLGTKTQVAAPRHRRTSQTGELIKHDQYFPLPLYPFIYSFLSHGLYSCGRKKNSLLSKVQRRSSCLTQYHNNWKPFFSLPLYRHSRSALRMSEYVIWRTIQTLWLIEEEKNLCIWHTSCLRKEKVRVWLSSQPPLKQSPVSEGAEDGHKVSIKAPSGTYTCLCTSIWDRKEVRRADGRVKDNHSGLSGRGQANALRECTSPFFTCCKIIVILLTADLSSKKSKVLFYL